MFCLQKLFYIVKLKTENLIIYIYQFKNFNNIICFIMEAYMKVAIIGSRKIGNLTIDEVIKNVPINCSLIISGGAVGVDTLAKQAAQILNIPIKEYLPDYSLYANYAPIIRNRQIVNAADQVIAFWDYKSKGTRSTLLECLKEDKPFKIIIIE